MKTIDRSGELRLKPSPTSLKARKSPLLIWLPVALYTALIFLTLPYLPPITEKLYAIYGQQAVSRAVNSLFAGALALSIWYLLRHKKDKWAYIWLGVFGAIYLYGLMKLKVPSERIHFLEYGLLSYFAFRALREEGHGHPNIYIWGATIAYFIGLSDETVQWVLPNRFGELRDVMLNALSGGLGQLLIMLVINPTLPRSQCKPWQKRSLVLAMGLALAATLLFHHVAHG